MHEGTCPLCGRQAKFQDNTNGFDGDVINCNACGKFEISGTAMATIASREPELRVRVGFWTRDQAELGEVPTVLDGTFALVKRLPERSVVERADRLLQYGIKRQGGIGGTFSPHDDSAAGFTHSTTIREVIALASLLEDEGWLAPTGAPGYSRITPRGYIHASQNTPSSSVNGFIAMWFDKSMDAARDEGLDPAIRAAGYTPIIVSGVEHVGKIDDEIVSQIRKSKFLVADFTGHRGGVYFEAGFAMGLGLPVFWTCRQDELSKLHFDIRQYNCIDWTTPQDLKTRLARRIEAVMGAGPVHAASAFGAGGGA